MSYIGNSPEFWNLNVNKYSYTASEGQTIFNAVYDTEVDVYLNGSKLQKNVDFTATDGVSVVLTLPAILNDVVDINGYFNMENFDITQYDGPGSGLDADTLDGKHASEIGGQMLGTATVKAINYNAQMITENITIPGTVNASSVGPVIVAEGYSVIISEGARFVIL